MFKPLLRTLPTLSGNFTIACKLREFNKENNNEYSTYVRLANMIPLQNFMSNKNIEINLLDGKYEYDVAKYYYYYSNVFYKHNYTYNKNNYAILDLDSIYNYNNDSRNKDYEFGCKRIQFSQHGSQFNFYAPIYIDNINDLPEYFCINIVINDHLTKKIKIYINKDNKRNYLKNYLVRYLKQIDERVIFCLPESLQATYFGIDIRNGGISQYKDNVFGSLYINQKTINNFDYTICKGFERNNIIMRQIIPLSFSFNINDLFNNYERDFFTGAKMHINGNYFTKGNTVYDMYDFDINYTNSFKNFKKYNEYTGAYDFVIGKDSNNKSINIMDVGFPALNESKYIKYAYTNKITPMYCKFKMMLSDDSNPYITNINFAYSYNQYPNQKYGEFPTMFKGLFPKIIIDNNDLKLPIGASLDKYYKVIKNTGNKVIINTNNIDKYNKLMSNYCSSWYKINNNFDTDNLDDFFNNENWSDVKYGYSYFNGILYNLKDIGKIDKFGVFCDVKLNYLSESNIYNNLIKGNIILSGETLSSGKKFFNYNQSYDMKIYDNDYNIEYFNKIVDISLNNFSEDNVKINQNMIKDIYGTYIIEENFIEENMFYKIDDIFNQFKIYLSIQELKDKLIEKQINGFELLEAYNNINFFNEKYDSIYGETVKQFMLIGKTYDTQEYQEKYNWLYNLLYYTTQLTKEKYKVSDNYNSIYYNEDINGKLCMFIKNRFIHKTDLLNILKEYNEDLLKFGDLNQLVKICFNYFVENERNIFHNISNIDSPILDENGKTIRLSLDNWLINQIGTDLFNELKTHYAYSQFRTILLQMITEYNSDSSITPDKINPNETIKGHNLIFLSNYLSLLQSYKFEILGNKNGIDIKDYFIKNESNEKDIYVDPYNLENYIDLYNKNHNDKISKKFTYRKIFSNIIDKNHLIEFCQKLKNFDNDLNPIISNVNLLDIIYVKERCWYIENNVIDIKDRYISLYDYLYNKFVEIGNKERIKYKSYTSNENKEVQNQLENRYLTCLEDFLKYFIYLHKSNNNGLILQWLENSLSDTKSESNKFILHIELLDTNISESWNIELDLCVYKNMILFDNNLRKLIQNNLFLYLYVNDKMSLENLSMWPIISSNDINNSKYIYKDTDDFLTPLFTNIYFNEDDFNNLKQMISKEKININNKYVLSSNKYFKEINVDETFNTLIINNDKSIYNIIDNINNLYNILNNDILDLLNQIKNLLSDCFNFTYTLYDQNAEHYYLQKILLESYINNLENENKLNNEIFDNNYKDIFIELNIIQDQSLLFTDIKDDINILQRVNDSLVKYQYQYNIYTYLKKLNVYNIFNMIDNIINDLLSYKLNNIDLLIKNDANIKHIINLLQNINNIYNEQVLSLFNNVKKLLNNLYNTNSYFKSSISNFNIKGLHINTLLSNKDIFIEQLRNTTFSVNWINEISNINSYNNIEKLTFKDKWNEYCLDNDIYTEDINSDNYIEQINLIIDYLKKYYNDLYYKIIESKGIILYSISNILNIDYKPILCDKFNYNDLYKIYTYDYNGQTYAFYFIKINVDNTNNSFNVLNEFNLNVKFDSIDGVLINDAKFNDFFNKIFYLLEPFLKLNIFNEFTKNINTIIYPHESEINIEYIGSITNNDTTKIRYSNLTDDGVLYDNIVKMSKSKKIKLLRYFNYITPLLVKTNVINDTWELQFIDNNNISIYNKKYNILSKENINIYKYNGIKYYTGVYSTSNELFMKNNNIEIPDIIEQYEYKHFNDNVVYNLPEEIYIKIDKYYTYDEISLFKENDMNIIEEKKNILLKYFNNLGLDFKNIILFLFNKYNSNMTIEPIHLRANKNEKLYKVSYKFNLI